MLFNGKKRQKEDLMIIVMRIDATPEQQDAVIKQIEKLGYKPHISIGTARTVIGAVGDERGKSRLQAIESMEGVENVVPILNPFKLAGREFKPEDTIVNVGKEKIPVGGKKLAIIAGPCSVEGEEQIVSIAKAVKKAGANMLRGGAFKPRTSPYDFQGLEEDGLKMLARAREETGLPIVTEILNIIDVDLIEKYADVFQVGARNTQNFALLKALGGVKKPVLLKRGMATTIKELLMSAEYIIAHGNPNVMLCERGIRTFETITRNTLDLNAVPAIKRLSHLPVIIDPSHGTGNWHFVTPMSYASVAAGADGLLVEVHNDPPSAWSDGAQSLKPDKFEKLMAGLKPIAEAVGKIV